MEKTRKLAMVLTVLPSRCGARCAAVFIRKN
jgi:hypothetical protein